MTNFVLHVCKLTTGYEEATSRTAENKFLGPHHATEREMTESEAIVPEATELEATEPEASQRQVYDCQTNSRHLRKD